MWLTTKLKLNTESSGRQSGKLKEGPVLIKGIAPPPLSHNLCFLVLIKDGGLSEEDAVDPYCNETNKNL